MEEALSRDVRAVLVPSFLTQVHQKESNVDRSMNRVREREEEQLFHSHVLSFLRRGNHRSVEASKLHVKIEKPSHPLR